MLSVYKTQIRFTRGITLIEIVVVLGIIALMSSITLAAFSNFRSHQTLDASIEIVLAAFSQAHLDTISSKNDYLYGVYLKSDEVITFRGTTYPGDGDPSNVHYTIPSTIEITNISINGGGSTIFYQRLSGATTNYGTFDVRLKSNTTIKTTVTINQTGVVSI
jgi:type II secretory pathway pseudopilin PulG